MGRQPQAQLGTALSASERLPGLAEALVACRRTSAQPPLLCLLTAAAPEHLLHQTSRMPAFPGPSPRSRPKTSALPVKHRSSGAPLTLIALQSGDVSSHQALRRSIGRAVPTKDDLWPAVRARPCLGTSTVIIIKLKEILGLPLHLGGVSGGVGLMPGAHATRRRCHLPCAAVGCPGAPTSRLLGLESLRLFPRDIAPPFH